VIDCAEIVEHIEMAELKLHLNYNQLQGLEYHLKKLDGSIIAQDFSDTVITRLKLPKHHVDTLLANLS
jgi:putative IMPACT (imprinted ancient) family translation regulator